jgi:hypothetical protein
MKTETHNIETVFDMDGYEDEYPGIESVKVEITVKERISDPFLYGADADGNRGEERVESEFELVRVEFPSEYNVPVGLQVLIRGYYNRYDSEDWSGLV